MKTIIAGSRTISGLSYLEKAIAESGYNITEVVSGMAKGVDMLGEHYAMINNIPVKQFPANWARLGRAAGIYRNIEMAEYADCAIILWDGISNGTKHMIKTMRDIRKPFYLVEIM